MDCTYLPGFNISFNVLLGEKPMALLAGRSISSPVLGLRPLRAARRFNVNVPNPDKVSLFPAAISCVVRSEGSNQQDIMRNGSKRISWIDTITILLERSPSTFGTQIKQRPWSKGRPKHQSRTPFASDLRVSSVWLSSSSIIIIILIQNLQM